MENRPLAGLADVISDHLKHLPGWEFEHVSGVPIQSNFDYNYVLTNPDFWFRFVHFDRVLIFQHDSKLLKAIDDEFLDYDYVGAPWRVDMPWRLASGAGGNGGLSIRNPRVMRSICQTYPYDRTANEDVYFCGWLERLGFKIAPEEVCRRFSCESVFFLGTCGYHAIDKHLSAKDVELIQTQYE